MVEPGDTEVCAPRLSRIHCEQTAQMNTSRQDRFFLSSNIQVAE